MFPYPSGDRAARRPPARLHRHRRVQPLPADGRAQRAVHDGLRRVRAAGRAVRRADRPAPGDHDRRRTSPTTAASSRRLGLSHDRRRSIDTTDPAYYRWTQWIFVPIFDAWYDPEPASRRRHEGRARPISELVAEFDVGHPAHGGRPAVARLSTTTSGPRRSTPTAWPTSPTRRSTGAPASGTVVANEEVTADGRSDRGNFPVFKRDMRQWMMRITAYADRLIDDLDVLDWTDSLKTMQRNWIGRSHGAHGSTSTRRPGRSPCSPPAPTRCSGRRSWCSRPSTRWSPISPPSQMAEPGAAVPAPGRWPRQGRRPPGRGPREDRRVHRPLRHQPGHRPGHPDLDRRLRADGLRHRGDHGRAVRRPARLRVRPRVRPRHPGDPAAAGRVVRRRAASRRRSTRGAGRRRSSATRRTSTRRTRDVDAQRDDVGRRRHRHHQRLAGGRGRRRGDDHLQAARLVVQPPALLGRAVPDRLRRRRPGPHAARRRCCRWSCPTPTASRRGRSTPTTSSPTRRARSTGWTTGSNVDARPRRRPAAVPPRHQRDAAVGRLVLVRAALLRPDQRRALRRPGGRALLDGPADRRATGPPRRRRPLRRRRRARRAAPAVRPLLAQGAVRPRLPVVERAVRPAVQPGLRAGGRVHRTSAASTSTAADVEADGDGAFSLRRPAVEPRVGQDGQEPQERRVAGRDLRGLRRRHAAAAPDGDGPARRLAAVGDARRGRHVPLPAAAVAQRRRRGHR